MWRRVSLGTLLYISRARLLGTQEPSFHTSVGVDEGRAAVFEGRSNGERRSHADRLSVSKGMTTPLDQTRGARILKYSHKRWGRLLTLVKARRWEITLLSSSTSSAFCYSSRHLASMPISTIAASLTAITIGRRRLSSSVSSQSQKTPAGKARIDNPMRTLDASATHWNRTSQRGWHNLTRVGLSLFGGRTDGVDRLRR
jgi:hypothetical protein